jgi:hypothetical protein
VDAVQHPREHEPWIPPIVLPDLTTLQRAVEALRRQ